VGTATHGLVPDSFRLRGRSAYACRAEDRTLTDEEVNRVFTAVQEGLVSGHGYTLRK
jgi:phenylalanyl-tRNA synthetase beta subunit